MKTEIAIVAPDENQDTVSLFEDFVRELAVSPASRESNGMRRYILDDEASLVVSTSFRFSMQADASSFSSITYEEVDPSTASSEPSTNQFIAVSEIQCRNGQFERIIGGEARPIPDTYVAEAVRRLRAAEVVGKLTLFEQ